MIIFSNYDTKYNVNDTNTCNININNINIGSANVDVHNNIHHNTNDNDYIIHDMTITVDTSFFLNKIICCVWMRQGDPRKLSDLAIIKNNRYIKQGLKNEYIIFEEKIDFHKIKIDELKNRLHEIYNQIIL